MLTLFRNETTELMECNCDRIPTDALPGYGPNPSSCRFSGTETPLNCGPAIEVTIYRRCKQLLKIDGKIMTCNSWGSWELTKVGRTYKSKRGLRALAESRARD